ncbi:outer membrane protein transport protein [Thaumasiovibrio subtropicus]|uniref:outer membrane protein transport protein n=1 Tax=Thaumasiovibrio subtropicus TaxID=1891207 RepID=UPI000B35F09E|nr:outer membrane protein transport protein [Thaumasiovibrio subtropicus]
MNKKRLFTPSLLALSVVGVMSQPVFAAGFQLNSQSATGLGRAFAGDAVIADNASVMSRNAAAMSLFDSKALSLGGIVLKTDIKVKGANYTNVLGQPSSLNDEEIGGTSVAPNLYFIAPINDQFTAGVSLYSNFGTKTEFSADYPANEFGGLTDLKSFNLGLSLAYRIDEQWSIGGGLDVIYGKGELKRSADLFAQHPQAGLISLPDTPLLDVDADGYALGFNLGVVYEHDEDNRFGFSYRYSPELEAEGKVQKINPATGGMTEFNKLVVPLPDMAEFSGYHKVADQFAVHYSVQWIGWKAFDKLETASGEHINTYEWQNGWHYSIGGTYYLNSSWTLRAGYMYDTSAQDEITSISVPDSDRNWFSAGFSYHLSEQSTFDFGATYLIGKDVAVKETSAIGTTISATTRANALLFGAQYSYTF